MIAKVICTYMLETNVPNEYREQREIDRVQFQDTRLLLLVIREFKHIKVCFFTHVKLLRLGPVQDKGVANGRELRGDNTIIANLYIADLSGQKITSKVENL